MLSNMLTSLDYYTDFQSELEAATKEFYEIDIKLEEHQSLSQYILKVYTTLNFEAKLVKCLETDS